jgi:hypothetical protein
MTIDRISGLVNMDRGKVFPAQNILLPLCNVEGENKAEDGIFTKRRDVAE